MRSISDEIGQQQDAAELDLTDISVFSAATGVSGPKKGRRGLQQSTRLGGLESGGEGGLSSLLSFSPLDISLHGLGALEGDEDGGHGSIEEEDEEEREVEVLEEWMDQRAQPRSKRKGGSSVKLRPDPTMGSTVLLLKGADIVKLLERKPELAEFLDLQIREMNKEKG